MRGALNARHGIKKRNSRRFRRRSTKTNKQMVIDRDIKRGLYADDPDDYDPLAEYAYESGAYESDLWD